MLSLCLVNYQTTRIYEEVEVQLHIFNKGRRCLHMSAALPPSSHLIGGWMDHRPGVDTVVTK
jgi:hypothetical protein